MLYEVDITRVVGKGKGGVAARLPADTKYRRAVSEHACNFRLVHLKDEKSTCRRMSELDRSSPVSPNFVRVCATMGASPGLPSSMQLVARTNSLPYEILLNGYSLLAFVCSLGGVPSHALRHRILSETFQQSSRKRAIVFDKVGGTKALRSGGASREGGDCPWNF